MANPNFDGLWSTNQVWRDLDETRCLTDDLDNIEADIAEMQTGKAASDHTHTGYAAAEHTHDGYAPATHSHTEYAPATHDHTGYAAENHTHDGYAPVTHDHTGYAAENHSHIVYNGATANTYKKVWLATTGNDENEGTAASPMATITGAIRKYGTAHKMLDITLADGEYTENIGPVSAGLVNLAIRSTSENKDAVTINMTTALECNIPIVRLYNLTMNVTETDIRPVVVTGGLLYAYNMRFNVPETSSVSCVNVYNGCSAFLMHCVMNSATSGNGACFYGNQANTIKAINCTSERTVSLAFYAHNGSTIIASDTINATTKTKQTYYGKVQFVTQT